MKYLIEMAISLFIAAVIFIAATTSLVNVPFVYQGF